jgi:pimeloyl-ACP methyl ester carboxylesterase
MIKSLSLLAGAYLNALSYLLPETAGRHGFNLFCFPVRSGVKPYHKKFFNTADSFTFNHDGVTIQGYRWGTGARKVLFLHGWQSHTFRWKNYIESLSKDEYSVYAIDGPGHGMSKGNHLSVPFYSAVIQNVVATLGSVHAVVAHSVGGFSMLHAFTEHPSIPVARLILLAPPGEASDFIQFYKETAKLSDRTISLILDHFKRTLGYPVEYFSSAQFAKHVPIPGYIIHDEDDPEAPYHHAHAIHKSWKKSVLITTKGLGHNLRSKDVVARVAKFISEPVQNPVMEKS